jgi:hypothetical protein
MQKLEPTTYQSQNFQTITPKFLALNIEEKFQIFGKETLEAYLRLAEPPNGAFL